MSFDPTRPPAALPSDLDPTTATAFLWDPATLRHLWASPAGARFWEAASAMALVERAHAPDEPTATELNRLARLLERRAGADGRRRLETTAVFLPAGVAKAVLCAVRRVTRDTGETALLVEILGEDPDAEANRWRAIFAATPVPLALYDADGALLEQNDAAARVFSDDAGAALEDRFVDSDEARRAMHLALTHGAYSQTVQLLLRAGPEPRRLRLARVSDPADGAPAVLSLALDPEPGGSGGDAAAVSVAAMDAAACGLGVIDLAGDAATLVSANPELTRLLREARAAMSDEDGYEPPETDLPPSILAALGPLAEEMDETAAAAARTIDLVSQASGGDSAAPGPWLRATLQRLGPGRFALTLIDLGPERRALLRLKIANEQTASALDALGVGLGAIDTTGRLLAISSAATTLLASDEESLLGRSLETMLPRSDGRRLLDYLALGPVVAGRALETGIETSLQPTEGAGEDTAVPVRFGIAPRSRLSPGRRRFAFHRALADAASGRRAGDAESAARRGAELAHALRTRLTSVQGFAELLLEETGPDQTALGDAYLADIVTAAQECVALVDRHLAPGDPAGSAPASPSAPPASGVGERMAALSPILRSAVVRRDDLLGRQGADRARIEVRDAAHARVSARPAQVREIFDRLLSAIEADAEPGPVAITLESPREGLALVTAAAPGAPVSSSDLSMRLLADDVGAINATMESDPTRRRIMVLFRTV